jgi:cytosine permease
MNTDASSPADATSDFAATALRLDARMPRVALVMAWWSICSAMFYLFLGATLALTYGTRNALIGMILAVASFGVLNGALARYAAKTGMSSSALSQVMLGAGGGALATLILCLTALYYAVFEGSVLAVTLSKVAPSIAYGTASAIIVTYSIPLVCGSVQHWFNRFNAALLPFYLLGLAALAVLTVRGRNYSDAWLHLVPLDGAPAHAWWSCFTAYFGVLALSMCTLDFARFGRPKDAAFHAGITFGVPFYAMTFLVNGVVGILLIGSVDAMRLSETSIVDCSLSVLGAGGGLAWVWVTQTRSNTANYYISVVNLQAFIEETLAIRLPKVLCAIAVGIVVLVLMSLTNVFSYLLTALNYQGIFVTAWIGVAISHIVRTLPIRKEAHIARDLNGARRGCLIAWLMGAITGIAVMHFGGRYASVSVPINLLVSGLLYRFFIRTTRSPNCGSLPPL